jgi:hypothetical protein
MIVINTIRLRKVYLWPGFGLFKAFKVSFVIQGSHSVLKSRKSWKPNLFEDLEKVLNFCILG